VGQLIYETSDAVFVNQAIRALREAKIDSYEIGGEFYQREGHYCIFIDDTADYAQANEILVNLGAVVEKPLRLPPVWVFIASGLLILAVSCWVALAWK
jgi:hypothetical protein